MIGLDTRLGGVRDERYNGANSSRARVSAWSPSSGLFTVMAVASGPKRQKIRGRHSTSRFERNGCSNITEPKHAEEKTKQQFDELRRWHVLNLDREDRVRELKREVNELLIRPDERVRYPREEAQTSKCHEPAQG